MTCTECLDLMLDVARLDAAPLVERDVLAHTAACSACRQRLERERSLSAGLRALAREADPGDHSEVEARLLEAFAMQHGQDRSPSAVRRTASRLALAATVVLGAGATVWWAGQRPSAPVAVVGIARPAATQAARVSQAASAASTERGASIGMVSSRLPAAHSKRRPARASRRAQGEAEDTGFVQIPSAIGLPDFESGEIVRLGIPVTSLPNYGVDIPAGAQSSIQADFLIGQDGQARAIRLVNASREMP